MKISKHLHSCLLVEERGKTLLFDPGIFTYQEKALDIQTLDKLDYILITHAHPDHLHMPYVLELLAKFPRVKIVTTHAIVQQLAKENIAATDESDALISLEKVPHEKLWDTKPPENVSITILGKLTSPGDALHIQKSGEILFLPIAAPWESVTEAVNAALTLVPKVIIPAHDWMWRDDFRKIMYLRLKVFFQTKGIDFKAVETGEIFEV